MKKNLLILYQKPCFHKYGSMKKITHAFGGSSGDGFGGSPDDGVLPGGDSKLVENPDNNSTLFDYD